MRPLNLQGTISVSLTDLAVFLSHRWSFSLFAPELLIWSLRNLHTLRRRTSTCTCRFVISISLGAFSGLSKTAEMETPRDFIQRHCDWGEFVQIWHWCRLFRCFCGYTLQKSRSSPRFKCLQLSGLCRPTTIFCLTFSSALDQSWLLVRLLFAASRSWLLSIDIFSEHLALKHWRLSFLYQLCLSAGRFKSGKSHF